MFSVTSKQFASISRSVLLFKDSSALLTGKRQKSEVLLIASIKTSKIMLPDPRC